MSTPTIKQTQQTRLKKLPILFDDLGVTALPDEQQTLISKIDACLPQTQCGLCEHPEGCLPYAHAIITKNDAPNKCVPGGQPVTDTIARIINEVPKIPKPSKWQIETSTQRPQEVRAIIREEDCIGCTKCIPACPVDAIVGTAKHMHAILTDLCTGCELCLAPCPVDCIDLKPIQRSDNYNDEQRQAEQNHLRERYHTNLNRVALQMQDKRSSKPVVSVVQSKLTSTANANLNINETQAKKAIASAKLRTKIKKLEKQLSVRENPKKRTELISYQNELVLIS